MIAPRPSGKTAVCAALVVLLHAIAVAAGSGSSGSSGSNSAMPPIFNGSGYGWRWFCEGNCYEDVTTTTVPGLILMGGGLDVGAAFHQQIKWSGGGDFVVLRSDIDNGYNDWIYRTLGGVNSVTSLIVFSTEAANDDFVIEVLSKAEAIFIAGGNQWNYFEYWQGTKVETVLRKKRNVVPFGGTSAGCMVLPWWVFNAQFGGITSSDALNNPMSQIISLSEGYLQFLHPPLTLVDTHFVTRDRFGRLLTFLSRLAHANITDLPKVPIWGIGIDEHTAFAVQPDGFAHLLGNGTAYVLHVDHRPSTCTNRQPLTMAPVHVQKLLGGVDTFNFTDMTGGSPSNQYRVGAVSGVLTSSNPYAPPSL